MKEFVQLCGVCLRQCVYNTVCVKAVQYCAKVCVCVLCVCVNFVIFTHQICIKPLYGICCKTISAYDVSY